MMEFVEPLRFIFDQPIPPRKGQQYTNKHGYLVLTTTKGRELLIIPRQLKHLHYAIHIAQRQISGTLFTKRQFENENIIEQLEAEYDGDKSSSDFGSFWKAWLQTLGNYDDNHGSIIFEKHGEGQLRQIKDQPARSDIASAIFCNEPSEGFCLVRPDFDIDLPNFSWDDLKLSTKTTLVQPQEQFTSANVSEPIEAAASTGIHLKQLSRQDLLHAIDSVPPGGGIAVVTMIPPHELYDKELHSLMTHKLQSGVAVTYFYSFRDRTPFHKYTEDHPSCNMIRKLRSLYGDYDGSQLRGYHFCNDEAQLVSDHTVLLMLSSDVNDYIPARVIQYTPYNVNELFGQGSAVDLRTNGTSEFELLMSHSYPIPWLGTHDHSRVLNRGLEYYDVLKSYLTSQVSLHSTELSDLLERILTHLARHRRDDKVTVLEVVSHWWPHADDATTIQKRRDFSEAYSEFILSWQLVRTQSGYSKHYILLKHGSSPGSIFSDLPEQCCATLHERLYDNIATESAYDVVILPYMPDCMTPTYIVKALWLLKANGLLVVMVPTQDNLLIRMCTAIEHMVDDLGISTTTGASFRHAGEVAAFLRRDLRFQLTSEFLRANEPDTYLKWNYKLNFYKGHMISDITRIIGDVANIVGDVINALHDLRTTARWHSDHDYDDLQFNLLGVAEEWIAQQKVAAESAEDAPFIHEEEVFLVPRSCFRRISGPWSTTCY